VISDDLDICAINLRTREAFRTDGAVIPITDLFDRDGDECEAEDAVTFVAGSGDAWFSDEIANYGAEPN